MNATDTFLGAAVRDPAGAFALVNERTGATVADSVERAFDSATRRRGLLGRDRLDEGHALVIAPCNSIHMFFMRFPIDVAFVDRGGTIVKGVPALRPWRIAAALRAFAAIELPAGALERTGTRPGDRLAVVPAEGRRDRLVRGLQQPG
jgi:uncharacterized membrane protein (UPF0127 family)